MSRFRRVQIDPSEVVHYDSREESASETLHNGGDGGSLKLRPSDHKVIEDQEPFMGVKVRRRASLHRDYRGDYLDVPSRPHLMNILDKQGDKVVLFADKVLKFTGSGKIKRRTLMITDFAMYIIDPDTDALKRRIALAAVEKLCMSELSDNFFSIIIPTEYDLLMASTRKTEIVTVLVEATQSEVDVLLSNRFEYQAASNLTKEVQFQHTEGGVKTRIQQK